MWLLLLLLREPIVRLFGVTGDGAELIRFFCIYVAGSWVFVGALFVANATFNNLGFPTWSTVFNWGRATVGTVPFVWIGATQFGAGGVLAGQAAGAVLFGIAAVIVSLRVVDQLATRHLPEDHDAIAQVAPPVPPFSSDKAATANDWIEPSDLRQ
jgi:Na+-driven multidrug efflux pump